MITSIINFLLTIKFTISLSLGQKYFNTFRIKIGLKKELKIKIKLKLNTSLTLYYTNYTFVASTVSVYPLTEN